MLAAKGLTQQWVVEQIDLTDCKVICCAPPRIELIERLSSDLTGAREAPRSAGVGALNRHKILSFFTLVRFEVIRSITPPTRAQGRTASLGVELH